MPSLNKVILVGRLTRDPELKYTASGLAVTTFSLAVDRRFKDSATGEKKTDFFRCKAWRQKAEFVSSYVSKGRLVAVEGSIETSEVVGQDGQKKYFTDIVCDNIELLESNREHGEGGAPGGMGGGGSAAGGQDDYGAEYSGGGNAAAAPAGNAAGGNAGGNGYFPDDDMGAAPRGNTNRPAQQGAQRATNPNAANPNAGAPQQRSSAAGGAPQRPAQTTNRPAPAAQAAYPQDDFDDSDPFADE